MADGATFLIMGPPGAGKGTQAAHVVERWGARHLATGDLLRAAVKAGTPLGVEAKSYMDAGGLVPDDVIIGLIVELLDELPDGANVLLDGFPRTVPQAEALDAELVELGRQVDVALDVRVPVEVLLERLSSRWICPKDQRPYNSVSNPPRVDGVCDLCGTLLVQRPDDQPEVVGARLDAYASSTAPVVGYYGDAGSLVVVDGDRPLGEVQAAIDAAVQRAVAPR